MKYVYYFPLILKIRKIFLYVSLQLAILTSKNTLLKDLTFYNTNIYLDDISSSYFYIYIHIWYI